MRRPLAAGLALVALVATPAFADPAGKTTLEETIVPGTGAFAPLVVAKGEKPTVRTAPGATARSRRARTRRSLAFFGQLTDPQMMDEMSPARVDFISDAGGAVGDGYRPQDFLEPQVFDQVIRNLNANRTSRFKAGGKKAKLGFAITTGDMADNQQLNETRWFTQILGGGPVDPFSGKLISDANPCNAKPQVIARLNAAVAARRYTGVADYDDYPDSSPVDSLREFWDPDTAAPSGGPYGFPSDYAAFPRYPGLMDRGQQVFTAEGLKVKWYIARGNHDGLLEGTVAASNDLIRSIATGCIKVFPTSALRASELRGKDITVFTEKLKDPAFIGKLLADAQNVPPDPDRRIIDEKEYKAIVGHGFEKVSAKENKASAGTATYYSFAPKRGLLFISFDTVAEGGGSNGNVDDPQYRWMKSELAKARRKRELVIVYAHHPLSSQTNATPDEAAGPCSPPKVGCDADPRNSKPLHLGLTGRQSMKDLLLAYPNVIAFVAGHIHDNRVTLVKKGRRAFWELTTASHIDWPQQSRELELMDNRDGTLSIFGTILDHAAPAAAPAPGPAAAFSEVQLASLARTLSWNDPQRAGQPGVAETADRRGKKSDRNVELLIRDPR